MPYKDDNNYIKYSGRLAQELAESSENGAVWANQFDNIANRQAHIETTGPEIWQQTEGKVDGFTCAIGTGGTLAGTAIYLKQQNPKSVSPAADPMGASMYHWLKHGELRAEGTSITEGIGQGRVTANIEGAPIDDAYQIPDEQALPLFLTCCSKKGCVWAGRAALILPVRCIWRAIWDQAIRLSPFCVISARGIKANCSIRLFWKKRACPPVLALKIRL